MSDGFLVDNETRLRRMLARYERSLVRLLLRRLLPNEVERNQAERNVRRWSRQHLPDGGLTLAGFNILHVMQITLVARKIPYLTAEKLCDLLRAPIKHPIMRQYDLVMEERQHDVAVGMVFPWPAWSKFVILHTIDRPSSAQIVLRLGGNQPVCVLETLEAFMDGVAATNPEE